MKRLKPLPKTRSEALEDNELHIQVKLPDSQLLRSSFRPSGIEKWEQCVVRSSILRPVIARYYSIRSEHHEVLWHLLKGYSVILERPQRCEQDIVTLLPSLDRILCRFKRQNTSHSSGPVHLIFTHGHRLDCLRDAFLSLPDKLGFGPQSKDGMRKYCRVVDLQTMLETQRRILRNADPVAVFATYDELSKLTSSDQKVEPGLLDLVVCDEMTDGSSGTASLRTLSRILNLRDATNPTAVSKSPKLVLSISSTPAFNPQKVVAAISFVRITVTGRNDEFDLAEQASLTLTSPSTDKIMDNSSIVIESEADARFVKKQPDESPGTGVQAQANRPLRADAPIFLPSAKIKPQTPASTRAESDATSRSVPVVRPVRVGKISKPDLMKQSTRWKTLLGANILGMPTSRRVIHGATTTSSSPQEICSAELSRDERNHQASKDERRGSLSAHSTSSSARIRHSDTSSTDENSVSCSGQARAGSTNTPAHEPRQPRPEPQAWPSRTKLSPSDPTHEKSAGSSKPLRERQEADIQPEKAPAPPLPVQESEHPAVAAVARPTPHLPRLTSNASIQLKPSTHNPPIVKQGPKRKADDIAPRDVVQNPRPTKRPSVGDSRPLHMQPTPNTTTIKAPQRESDKIEAPEDVRIARVPKRKRVPVKPRDPPPWWYGPWIGLVIEVSASEEDSDGEDE